MRNRYLKQMNLWIAFQATIVFSSVVFIWSAALSADPPKKTPLLWREIQSSVPFPSSDETISSMAVKVDRAALTSSVNARFSLQLPGGRSITVVKSRQERVGDIGFVWNGVVENDQDSFVTFSVTGDTVDGTIIDSSGNFFRLSDIDGTNFLEEVDSDKLPSAEKMSTEDDQSSEDKPGSMNQRFRALQVANVCTDDWPSTTPSTVIDVMVLYTENALRGARGNINHTVNMAISQTNNAFEQSHINVKLNLVSLKKVKYPETGDPQEDLNNLQTKDAIKDDTENKNNVDTLRNNSGADLVVLIVETSNVLPLESDVNKLRPDEAEMVRRKIIAGAFSSPGGKSTQYLQGDEKYAFGVVVRKYATSWKRTYGFAHEVGHMLGAHHDLGESDSTNPLYDTGYNHGYINQGKKWVTIMANTKCDGCKRIPLFSNPNVKHKGDPIGVPYTDHDKSTSQAADNHCAINQNAGTVSRYRPLVEPTK